MSRSGEYGGLSGVRNAFRAEGGPWKSGSVYLYMVSQDGRILFHGSERFREGQLANLEREDVNGFRFVEAVIKAGAAGGGIVEYYYDDPATQGDEATGSPKLGYATGITFPGVDGVLVIGSGLYIAE